MKGAGGTEGGIGQFFLGFVMMCGGFYMLLNAIVVTSSFGFGARLYGWPGMGGSTGITGGMLMIPFILGVGMIFYNYKNYFGWLLAVGALAALIIGVIASVQMNLRSMSAFELIVILVLAIGGLGLFLRSLRSAGSAA